tara:strand:+ start:282 stop:509 length:228 start_codon:yes stop_codon:yes gene_type:complete
LTSFISRIDPWGMLGLYMSIEGSLGLPKLGSDKFGIFGMSGIVNLGKDGILDMGFEHPVNISKVIRIKVNLIIIS